MDLLNFPFEFVAFVKIVSKKKVLESKTNKSYHLFDNVCKLFDHICDKFLFGEQTNNIFYTADIQIRHTLPMENLDGIEAFICILPNIETLC